MNIVRMHNVKTMFITYIYIYVSIFYTYIQTLFQKLHFFYIMYIVQYCHIYISGIYFVYVYKREPRLRFHNMFLVETALYYAVPHREIIYNLTFFFLYYKHSSMTFFFNSIMHVFTLR